jgi:transcriptional regulator with XRE-family HTH domain
VSDTFGARLKLALAMRQKSKQWLDDEVLSRGATGRYVNEKRGARPSADVVDRIATALNMNATWLATGRGEPTAVLPSGKVAEPYPARAVVYNSDEFKNAHHDVQKWLGSRRPKSDLTVAQWREALDSAARLHALGLLDVPRGRRASVDEG